MNHFDNMREAMREARATMNAADEAAQAMAEMLVGRLSKVRKGWVLSALKRELRNYNIHTGAWNEKP
jgi:hypothetical protein